MHYELKDKDTIPILNGGIWCHESLNNKEKKWITFKTKATNLPSPPRHEAYNRL